MRFTQYLLVTCITLLIDNCIGFKYIGSKQLLYEYIGKVSVGAKPPQDLNEKSSLPPPTTGWTVKGRLTLQKQSENTLAAALAIEEVTIDNTGEKFHQNKEMHPPYKPFKIVIDGTTNKISHLIFKESDPIWSTNFKRAIASTLQLQLNNGGSSAFSIDEKGIHGKCPTEYYITDRKDHLVVRKTPELKACSPFYEGIHLRRSNVPANSCEFDFQKNVIIGNDAVFELYPHSEHEYLMKTASVKGITLIHTFESTGEAQYVDSELKLNFLNETDFDIPIDIETGMSEMESNLQLLALDVNDPTAGRFQPKQEDLIRNASSYLNKLAENLETIDLKFDEPYDSIVSDIIKVLSHLDYTSLQTLYNELDIGTSYRQETIRNIFYEILPRVGTKSSVLLTRDLIMVKQLKAATAVQLLISFPFHIYDLSVDLVRECEAFLSLGPDRPDVRQAAILSYATLIYNVFVAKKMTNDEFEEYVQKYFNFYLNGHDYEQKMLYLQGLGNLQLGNVANYLDPIIKDPKENSDLKFLAAWTTMPLAYTRSDKIYEIYWPIFESNKATLELRVAALTLLIVSKPTPARLISIHRIIKDETDPHLINYYRTTIKSISETTYPCYQPLRRLLSYMHRHLPPAPASRYWVTGNYIFDYRDSKFGIGAMLQAFLVGDPISDLPVVAYFKFDTEALGKFTGQLALYIKARGLSDAFLNRFRKLDLEKIKLINLVEIFEKMNIPKINSTPLHLEFIIQIEGKTVLSYYLNQKTFVNLSYGDLISRLNILFLADSHINMQTVRWPFMTKFAVPTVLGTPGDVLIQKTVLTSLRGNISQITTTDSITRSHEIDARYNSYASCKSRSYNPFLNLDHEINREQGILVYFPVNNEITINITDLCLKFSFSRPPNSVSGLTFKSRSVTITKGIITNNKQFKELILQPRKQNTLNLLEYDIKDLGISISVNTNVEDLNSYRTMFLKLDFTENGFTKNILINGVMYLFSIAQLSSIHIGYDRNFTMLLRNNEMTRINGSICTKEYHKTGGENVFEIVFGLSHLNDKSEKILHDWNFIIKYLESSKTQWYKTTGIITRSSHDSENYKACLNIDYLPLSFAKKPHTLNGKMVFGLLKDDEECPVNASQIILSATAGTSDNTSLMYQNPDLSEKDLCPKEMLKLMPIPLSNFCNREHFKNLTSVINYKIEMEFQNMPERFEFWANRLDHLVAALSEEKLNSLGLNKQLSVNVHIPKDQHWLTIDVNNVTSKIYHVPFLQMLYDLNYENGEFNFEHDSGIIRSCSIIRNTVSTFDGNTISATPFLHTNNETCSTLLVGDCSTEPKMAIFLTESSSSPILSSSSLNETETIFGIKVYVGGNYFTVKQQDTIPGSPVIINVNDELEINIREKVFVYPSGEENYDFKIEINEQNILIIENELLWTTIQYDMKDILNIEVLNIFKDKMCGLCGGNSLYQMENYHYCK
ncbi:uncharacterized protein LOC129607901 isoform X2 [Condylostylus longicornis]|uniref:uncharacterized protein LOC129607901 isoform X2 n=1 Tax=Condylostylus longicornis TaxID=2530218 RepID=UPI00244DC273|nr:uncharacterized protein LOC129607901 isoform X2 [Condylostylus longicornis]